MTEVAWKSLSRVRLFVTPWTVACKAPLSMEFSRQGHWSMYPFPSPGVFPTWGLNPGLWHCRRILYHLSPQGSHLPFARPFICDVWDFSCGMQTLSCSMWYLVSWPGVDPGFPALGVLARGPPGKSSHLKPLNQFKGLSKLFEMNQVLFDNASVRQLLSWYNTNF